MERNGFNPSSFETSGDKSDDSKEKSKSKKKKSAETAVDITAESKKEVVADRTKALLDKFLSDKAEKVEKADKNLPNEETETDDTEPQESEESEAEFVGEEDPSLEQLTPEEDAEITRQLVDEKLAELESGRGEQEAPEDIAGREAAITMLEQMRDETVEIDSAADDTTPEAAENTLSEESTETTEVPRELDDEQTVPLSKSTSKPSTSNPDSGQGGTAVPPRSAQREASFPRAPGGSFGEVNRTSAIATAEKTEYQPDYRVNPNATYLLVGGIVGYLIGRRRGRIKTEKRLAVVQRKLEKQVEAKQHEINEKTEAVQKLARQNYEQMKLAGKSASARSAERVTSFSERPQLSREQPSAVASQGRSRAELPRANPERQDSRMEKSVELSNADISRLSETITIGATNLRKIHEAKLITDGGLRRLVNEHLQGKDIRRGLAREFLTKELSYERDPRFRDIVPLEANGQRPQGGAVGQTDVQPVALASAGIAASLPSRPTGIRKPIPVKQKRSAVSTGLLTVLSFVALALAAYAVWLGLMR